VIESTQKRVRGLIYVKKTRVKGNDTKENVVPFFGGQGKREGLDHKPPEKSHNQFEKKREKSTGRSEGQKTLREKREQRGVSGGTRCYLRKRGNVLDYL